MDVGIIETRDHGSTTYINYLGFVSPMSHYLFISSDSYEASVSDSSGGSEGSAIVLGSDATVHDNQICVYVVARRCLS